jgi:ubiquinone/menaquinone biosynthesis C-methylase UbiE
MRRSNLRRLAYLVVMAFGLLVLIKVAVQIYIQLRPRITPPAMGWILHSRARRLYRSFDRTLHYLDLQPGQRVLEIGGGTGAFTIPMAQCVAPDGVVYSIEIQPRMLDQQRQRVGAITISNIRLHQADARRLPFGNGVFDRAALIACLPMISNKQLVLSELRRVLKADGLLLVSEEIFEPEYVPLAVTRAWCWRAGFREVAAHREALFYSLVLGQNRDRRASASETKSGARPSPASAS